MDSLAPDKFQTNLSKSLLRQITPASRARKNQVKSKNSISQPRMLLAQLSNRTPSLLSQISHRRFLTPTPQGDSFLRPSSMTINAEERPELEHTQPFLENSIRNQYLLLKRKRSCSNYTVQRLICQRLEPNDISYQEERMQSHCQDLTQDPLQ